MKVYLVRFVVNVLVNTLILMTALVFFFGCVNESGSYAVPAGQNLSEDVPDPVKSTFDKRFRLRRKITLQGTANVPVYSIGHFAVTDSSFIIPDGINHRVLRFSRSGELIDVWGNEGKGPGEFKEPNWAGVDDEGRVYIREGVDNFRVQIFDHHGIPIRAFSLNAFGPFTESFLVTENKQTTLITTTRVYCGKDHGSELCTIQEQDLTGRVIRKYAAELEVEEGRLGLPFVAGRDKQGYVYVAHRNGGRIVSYDSKGVFMHAFRIDQSPEVKVLDTSGLARDPVKRVQQKKDMSYTIIRNVNPVENHIVIDYYRVNFDDDMPKMFIDIYDDLGNLKYFGITTPYALEVVQDNKFFFVQEDEEADYGLFEIYEYELH